MANAISLLAACYYVFNIADKAKPGNVFLFCEATLLDMPTEAKRRVALNKFNSSLNLQNVVIMVYYGCDGSVFLFCLI